MNRFILATVFLLWSSFVVLAQDLPKLNGLPVKVTANSHAQSDHLIFKGIPIDGDIEQFSKQLISVGYKESLRFTEKYIKWFEGMFMDEKCFIGVFHSPKGLVGRVDVLYLYPSYSEMNSAFNDAISLYRTKYGSPDLSQSDVYIWDVPHGGIAITKISNDGKYKLLITYEDSKNGEIVVEERNAAIKREKASRINDI